MIRIKGKKAILLTVSLLQAFIVMAQDPFDLDEVRVVAPYEPTISDAFKILLSPRIEDTLDLKLDFTYLIPPRKIQTSFELEPISPARMRGEPLPKLYRSYIRGGVGSYSTPYFEGFYNSLRSNTGTLAVHLKHHSSGGGIPDVGHNAYSDNQAGIHAQRFFSNTNLDGNINYERNVMHYYGFKRASFENDQTILDFINNLAKDDIRQQFDLLSTHISFGTNQADSSRFRHHNRLEYNWLQDHFDSREHQVAYTGHVGRNIAADPFGMADNQYFSLDLTGNILNTLTQLDTANTYLFGLRPKLWSQYRNFQFYLGVNAVFELDTVSHFRAYPLLGAELNVMENQLVAFLHLSGNTEKHSMLSLTRENPFLNTASPYSFMNIRSDIGGGIKGAVGDIFGYSLSLNRAMIDNHPFFVNDTATILNNTFSVVYDNISRFNIRANISARFGERFSATITGNYYQYGMNKEAEAWHTPSTTLNANVRYNIQDKIILHADIIFRGKTYARMFDVSNQVASVALPMHTDVNVGIEYRYTKRLSVFMNFANVGNKSLERWMNYPTHAFNFLGGAAFSF